MVIVGVLLGVNEDVGVTGMRVMVDDGSVVGGAVAVFGAAAGVQAAIAKLINRVKKIRFKGVCSLGGFLLIFIALFANTAS